MPKKQPELPAIDGPGVAPLEIKDIDKAISKYQRLKDVRCQASPGEIEAKQALKAVLHAHRDELPVNAEGVPFYRSEDRDYLLTESLKVRKVEGAEDEDDD